MKFGTFLVLSLACVAYVRCKVVKKDCSEESLAKLSFYKFLEKTNECENETRSVFETKYVDTVFKVQGQLVDNRKDAIQEDVEEIFIKNVDVTKNILDTFGDLIRTFVIDFDDIDAANGYEIFKHVNSLEKLDSFTNVTLVNCHGNVLDEWKMVFPNVKTFTFSSSSKEKLEIKIDQKLNHFLPAIEELILAYTRVSDWIFIGDEFPELKTFNVELPEIITEDRPDENQVLGLLKNSTNVEYLIVKNANLKLLQGANGLLGELKNLKIDQLSKNCSDEKIDSVELKNVKYFTIETESLSKKLLLNFTQTLPQVENIEISTKSKFLADDIREIVEHNKELQSLVLFIQMEEAEQKVIFDKFDLPWAVAVIQTGVKGSVQITVTKVKLGTGSLATHSIQLLIISLIATLIKSFGVNF